MPENVSAFRELTHEQVRQSIDVEQVYSAWRSTERDLTQRFRGTMNWRKVNGTDYLYRIVGSVAKSLGPRTPETEGTHASFHGGKRQATERKRSLTRRLDAMAPVNRALGLGRIPTTSSRILRALGRNDILGTTLKVVGTNALYAYERMAAVQVDSGLAATGDVDLLFDNRRHLKLAASGLGSLGLIGLLRQVDRSFVPVDHGSFRAVNDEGFVVDFICPPPPDRLRPSGRRSISDAPGDLSAVEIEGPEWLLNAPGISVTVIDERGYPLVLACPDPRAFALHKLWLSSRADREVARRARDRAQAHLVAELLVRRLPNYPFDDDAALPLELRALRDELPAVADGGSDRSEPDW